MKDYPAFAHHGATGSCHRSMATADTHQAAVVITASGMSAGAYRQLFKSHAGRSGGDIGR